MPALVNARAALSRLWFGLGRNAAVATSALLALSPLACDGGPAAPPIDGEPAPVLPGPACLVASASSLDFGSVLAGQQQTAFVAVTSCDGEPVTISRLSVPDDGDMLIAARIYKADGSVITPLLPYLLEDDEDMVVAVTYRARASARDQAVSRTLRFVADSREVPSLPGTFDVGLVAQPVTACPDDTCGGSADGSVSWPLGAVCPSKSWCYMPAQGEPGTAESSIDGR